MVSIGLIAWVFLGIESEPYQTSLQQKLNSQDQDVTKEGWESKDPNVLVIGNANSKATIYEYSDFKCPECAKYHQDAGKKIRAEYVDTGRVKIVFRPYPVYATDGGDLLLGSYCAQEQRKLEQYHDIFFEYMWENHFKQGDYDKAIDQVLVGEVRQKLFNEIGLNTAEFNDCMQSKRYDNAYWEDLLKSGPDEIQGTPSFIINGQKVVGTQPYPIFKTLIDLELKKVE